MPAFVEVVAAWIYALLDQRVSVCVPTLSGPHTPPQSKHVCSMTCLNWNFPRDSEENNEEEGENPRQPDRSIPTGAEKQAKQAIEIQKHFLIFF